MSQDKNFEFGVRNGKVDDPSAEGYVTVVCKLNIPNRNDLVGVNCSKVLDSFSYSRR